MTVSVIMLIVSLIVLLACALCGVFGGLRKGAFRSLVKLGALLLAVIVSLIVSLCVRGVIADNLLKILPDELDTYRDLVELIVQIPASVVLLVVFALVFTVVRLLLLIPQSIVSKMLPRTFDDIRIDPSKETDGVLPHRDLYKTLWKITAALCGMLSSILLLGALLMPISGAVTRGGEAIYRISDTLAKENHDELTEEVSEQIRGTAHAPLFTVTDFFYGKTVFEPLTSFNTDYGRINLSYELENATDLACEILPITLKLDEGGSIGEEDIDRLTASAEQLTESKFLMTVAAYVVNEAGEELADSDSSEMKKGKQDLQNEVAEILTDMTPDGLSDGMHTLISLIDLLADSPLLKAMTDDSAELSPADLADRELMRDLLGILYDNSDTRHLLVPLVNFASETIFDSLKVDPIYSNTDIDKVSREQVVNEADLIANAADGLSAFAESLDEENADITSYRLKEAGIALDSLRSSIFFGDQYEVLVRSITSADEGGNELMKALGDALCSSESAQDLLVSAQSIALMNKALESGSQKGSQNEELMSAMDVLLNHTTKENADTLSTVAGDHFFGNNASGNTDTKVQMIEDYMAALVTVSEKEEKNTAAEADAMQTFYDLSHDDKDQFFSQTSEEDAVDALLQSDIAFEMLKKLNAEGKDYGIRAKLSASNLKKIEEAIDASSAGADRKAAVADFFGIK